MTKASPSTTSTAIATDDNSAEPEPERAACAPDDYLALPWPVTDADEGRRLRREMVLRALI
jgi:hypothetical protein